MCGDYGTCSILTTYQGQTYGQCECIYGYAGDFCDTLFVDNYVSKSYFLILSNLAILPAAAISFVKSLYVESFLFFSLGIISSFYHACDIKWLCVVDYEYLQKLDFVFSFNSILLCLFHLSGIRPRRKAVMQLVGFTLLVVLIAVNPTTMTNWFIIGGIGGGQLLIAWTTYFIMARVIMGRRTKLRKIIFSFFFLSDNFYLPILFLGSVFWIAAVVCWFLKKGPSYWMEHSLWHIFAMSAAGALMACRKGHRYKLLDANGVDTLPRVLSPISKRPFFGENDELKPCGNSCVVSPSPRMVIPASTTPILNSSLNIDIPLPSHPHSP
ncbi:hypothetical protein AC1031_013073 [Aphanomyces cochlioides]|nr:hypothetical protein AC1031_013073 [Aphanomyces cochlioides]